MQKTFVRSAAIATLALVAACATPSQRGTEVTRFHLGQVIPAQADKYGTGRSRARSPVIEYQQYAAIVAQQLATHRLYRNHASNKPKWSPWSMFSAARARK